MRDRCCQFPGCGQLASLEAHHIEHWFDLGPTNKDNLTFVCAFHHQRLHEGGFSAKRNEDGSLAVFDPAGRPLERMPTPPTLPDSGARILHRDCAMNDVAINPRTNLVHDNGEGLDLGMAVDAILPSNTNSIAAGVSSHRLAAIRAKILSNQLGFESAGR